MTTGTVKASKATQSTDVVVLSFNQFVTSIGLADISDATWLTS